MSEHEICKHNQTNAADKAARASDSPSDCIRECRPDCTPQYTLEQNPNYAQNTVQNADISANAKQSSSTADNSASNASTEELRMNTDNPPSSVSKSTLSKISSAECASENPQTPVEINAISAQNSAENTQDTNNLKNNSSSENNSEFIAFPKSSPIDADNAQTAFPLAGNDTDDASLNLCTEKLCTDDAEDSSSQNGLNASNDAWEAAAAAEETHKTPQEQASEDKAVRKQSLKQAASVGSFGLFLLLAVVFGYFIGSGMDKFFGTKPWFTVFWVCCGIASAVMELIKGIKAAQNPDKS